MRRRRILGGARVKGPASDNQIGRALGHRRRPLHRRAAFKPETAINGRDVLALDKAIEAQLIKERDHRRRLAPDRKDETESIGAAHLLCARRERPGCHGAAEQRDDLAPSDSITSSAVYHGGPSSCHQISVLMLCSLT